MKQSDWKAEHHPMRNNNAMCRDIELVPNHSARSITAKASGALALTLAASLAACQPTIKVEAPDKPIVINLNIKIEQEVRVRIDRELDQEFSDNPELFN